MLYSSPRSDAMHLLRTFKLYYIKSDERIQFSPANSLFFFKAIFTVNAQKQNKREMVKRKKKTNLKTDKMAL